MSEHTPTPWALGGRATIKAIPRDGYAVYIATLEQGSPRAANAEFILRACNAHDELVTALKTVAAQHALFVGPDDDIANAVKEVVRAALAKADAS